nr:MAG TPA: hypothetical protein [Caudoviricetes sp.]
MKGGDEIGNIHRPLYPRLHRHCRIGRVVRPVCVDGYALGAGFALEAV